MRFILVRLTLRISPKFLSNFSQIPLEFLPNSFRIPSEFLSNSSRIPLEFLPNSSRIPAYYIWRKHVRFIRLWIVGLKKKTCDWHFIYWHDLATRKLCESNPNHHSQKYTWWEIYADPIFFSSQNRTIMSQQGTKSIAEYVWIGGSGLDLRSKAFVPLSASFLSSFGVWVFFFIFISNESWSKCLFSPKNGLERSWTTPWSLFRSCPCGTLMAPALDRPLATTARWSSSWSCYSMLPTWPFNSPLWFQQARPPLPWPIPRRQRRSGAQWVLQAWRQWRDQPSEPLAHCGHMWS